MTNVSPFRPPENKAARLKELGVSWEECTEALWELVRLGKPNCVLVLGDVALQALTGKSGITAWRGTILHNGVCKVVPSFHPAYVLRLGDKTARKEREGLGGIKYSWGSAKVTLKLDVLRAKQEAAGPGLELLERQLLWGLATEEELIWLRLLEGKPWLAFDIETKGRWADRIAFAWNPSFSLSVELGKNEEVDGVVERILGTHKGLIAQNGAFDMTILREQELEVGRLYADTMIAHHILYPELPHDLGYLASVYCRMGDILHPAGWNEEGSRGQYNALHAAVTMECWLELLEEMREVGYV